MLGRKAQSGRTRQGPPAVWPSRRIEGPWLRATAATRLPVKAARPHYMSIGRRSLLEDARPHHHPGRNRPPLGQSVDSLPPGACSRRQTATLHWSCMDERRVAFRGRGSSTVLSTTVLSYPPHLAIHPQRPRASPLWLRRPALAACIDYLGPPALCVARVARRSLLSTAPARPFCCDKEAHRHPLSPPAQWLPQGRGMRRRATFPACRKRRPTRRAH
jgi:hypothetical protein